MWRAFGPTLVTLLALAAPAEAQRGSNGMSARLALGVAAQNRDDRSLLGWAARVGVGGPISERFDWAADVSFERFGSGSAIVAPCPPDAQCPDTPDALTLGHASAVLALRESEGPNAYLVAGGGLTRIMTSGVSRRMYAQTTVGIGWTFTHDLPGPFLEVRFTKFLRAREPMSAWSLPVVAGMRF